MRKLLFLLPLLFTSFFGASNQKLYGRTTVATDAAVESDANFALLYAVPKEITLPMITPLWENMLM